MKKKIRYVWIYISVFIMMIFSTVTLNAAQVNHLVLEEFEIENKGIVPGQPFQLVLKFKNTDVKNTMNNVLITYTNNADTIYSAYGTSNQIYVNQIYANKEQEIKLNLIASDKLKANIVEFQLKAECTNADTNTITIQIPVLQTSQLQTQEVNLADEVIRMDKTKVSVTIKNSGLQDLYHIVMHIKAGQGQEQEKNIGTLAAGKVNYIESNVQFKTAGEEKLTVYFTYEDIASKSFKTEDYTVTANVLEDSLKHEQNRMEQVQGITQPTESKKMLVIYIVLMLGIMAMSGIVIKQIRQFKA